MIQQKKWLRVREQAIESIKRNHPTPPLVRLQISRIAQLFFEDPTDQSSFGTTSALERDVDGLALKHSLDVNAVETAYLHPVQTPANS